MKHIKKHPINDKAQKLSKDIKKQDHSKPASKKKLDADKSLSDPEVSMKVTKPSNKKLDGEKFLANPTINTRKPNKPSNKNLDGEKFLAEGLNHLKRFNENLEKTFEVPNEFEILIQDIGPNPNVSDIIECWNDLMEDNPIVKYDESSDLFILEDGENKPHDIFLQLNDYLSGE